MHGIPPLSTIRSAGGSGGSQAPALPSQLKRILAEPLHHFLLLGVGIFALYAWLGGGAGAPDRRIVVSAADVAQMTEVWAKRWGRPPTPGELRGLVDARVREEVLYREALALGLDRDDTIVRRRLAQKLEFLFEDLGGGEEPGEDELRAYLAQHPDRFGEPARLTFSHVYVSRDRHGEAAEPDAARILATLQEISPDGDPGAHGDALPLARTFTNVDRDAITGLFGTAFAERVTELPTGAWHGPVESAYGAHLVFVHQRSEPRLPKLEEVKQRVRDEWRATRRRDLNEAIFERLLARYDVVIEEPGSPRTPARAALERGTP